jgi:REP element-mobilizing transposase RayT
MIYDMSVMTFTERERMCQRVFDENGPFWHLYTDGTIMQNVFCDEADMRRGMMALAVTAVLFDKVNIITFELMSNHVHMILSGGREDCMEFFARFKSRLKLVLRSVGRVVDWDSFQAQIIKIEDLRSLRNEIIYVNRNAYVVNTEFTPFSYPWGGGWAYFSPVIKKLQVKTVKDVGFNKSRELTRCREVAQLGRLRFLEDVAFIPSFCRVEVGEALFHDARSYFYSLTRNVEAYSEIAARLKDKVFLTQDELYAVAVDLAGKLFEVRQFTLLTPEQKIILAKDLHYKFNASIQQLRRMLNLETAVLSQLFPFPSNGRP